MANASCVVEGRRRNHLVFMQNGKHPRWEAGYYLGGGGGGAFQTPRHCFSFAAQGRTGKSERGGALPAGVVCAVVVVGD